MFVECYSQIIFAMPPHAASFLKNLFNLFCSCSCARAGIALIISCLFISFHDFKTQQGSVLMWDQRVAHGTAPNASASCRMAQYLKAFSRSKTFPVSSSSVGGGAGSAGAETVCSESNNNSVHRNKVEEEDDASTGAYNVDSDINNVVHEHNGPCNAVRDDVTAVKGKTSVRLRRRSAALEKLLKENNARDVVSELGKTLFGLDVLE